MCGVQTGRGISASLWTGSPSRAPPLLQMAPGSEEDTRYTKTKTCSMQGMLESLKRYCSLIPRLLPSLIPTLLPSICHILYEVPGYTITGEEPGNKARRTVA